VVRRGTLQAGDPTFNRLVGCCSTLSTVGTNVYYDTFTVTLPAGTITANLTGDATDTYLFLYQAPFSSGSPATNALAANDDFGSFSQSQFSATIPAGTYVFVVSSYGNGDTFNYTLTVTSP
jgi:hypothetical protein